MKNLITRTAGSLAIGLLLASSAFAAGMLTDSSSGRTLYVFDKDAPGVSNCDVECIKTWVPYAGQDDTQQGDKWTTITRTDGIKQRAYDGRPLYFFVDDKMKGDMKGDYPTGEWHVVPM